MRALQAVSITSTLSLWRGVYFATRIRRGSKRIRGADGGRTRNEDCCCPGCDCETDGPTAGFSYEQTDDDPCAFDFTDETAAGLCGEIVSWLWDFGDGDTSTDQNPSHTYSGDGPWDVTLTVTDENDCEDAVVGEVECLSFSCTCDGVGVPKHATVTLSDWGWFDGANHFDPAANTVHTLTLNGSCDWVGSFVTSSAPGCSTTININLHYQSGGIVISFGCAGCTNHTTYSRGSTGCRGTWHVSTVVFGGCGCCIGALLGSGIDVTI